MVDLREQLLAGVPRVLSGRRSSLVDETRQLARAGLVVAALMQRPRLADGDPQPASSPAATARGRSARQSSRSRSLACPITIGHEGRHMGCQPRSPLSSDPATHPARPPRGDRGSASYGPSVSGSPCQGPRTGLPPPISTSCSTHVLGPGGLPLTGRPRFADGGDQAGSGAARGVRGGHVGSLRWARW